MSSSVPVFTNYTGTTSDSFTIGKKGVQLLQDSGNPAGVPASPGSLFIRKDTAKLYQIDNSNNWTTILTTNSVSSDDTINLDLTSDGNLNFGVANNVILPGVQGIVLPIGNTSVRSSDPSSGTTRYNSDYNCLEVFNGTSWVSFGIPTSYTSSFAYNDIQSNSITFTHNLNQEFPLVQVWNNASQIVIPENVTSIDQNNISVQIDTVFSGTWNVRISI